MRNSAPSEDHNVKVEVAAEVKAEGNQLASTTISTRNIDIGSLGAKFFPNLGKLDKQDICPSLKNFNLGDPEGSLDIPLLKTPENWRQEHNSPRKGNLGDQTGVFLDGDNIVGFDDDEGDLAAFDHSGDAGFGEGGEAWVKTAAIEPQMHMPNVGFADEDMERDQDDDGIAVGDFDPHSREFAVSLHRKKDPGNHEDILSYFDNALQKIGPVQSTGG